jgi:DNA-binding response OmpR family regulator
MKAKRATILLYGCDEALLARRRWVLESRGYRILTLTDLREMRAVASAVPPSLLLLCHSLTPKERASATAAAIERWPEIRMLTLDAESSQVHSGLLGQLLHTQQGPDKLIAEVERLIGAPHAAARS